ncbi:Acetyl-hydrolase [Pseudolycoriella hygida]|uniref:Acetyl-hydrolase n=1 Tax=Pseudolycoriella hygida TaxID=35572 RepID=A0A9Q0MIT4_9DIPT|nr:Acetyl-hydrolase [Pseudolycoriella hygida]
MEFKGFDENNHHVQKLQIDFVSALGDYFETIVMCFTYVYRIEHNVLSHPSNLSSSHLVLIHTRNLLHIIPISVRRSIVKRVTSIPLWLSRFFLNIATSPIGDEWKWIHKIEQSTWKGVWIAPDIKNSKQAEDAALNNDLTILYTHGGGYCMGHPLMYMETFQFIIDQLRKEHNIRASILSLDYSLSPEHVWPKARDEAMDAYRYLVKTIGIPPSKIIFAGDSAGGNLAATMLLTIKGQASGDQEYLSLPAGVALLSPWIDLTINQPSFAQYRNDILSRTQVAKFVPYYIPNYDKLDEESRISMIKNPLISPLYGDFTGACPIFLAYGDKELLRTSIENMKSNLERDGCNVTTLKGEDALHIWLVSRLMSLSRQIFEKDCKTLINWMASICK